MTKSYKFLLLIVLVGCSLGAGRAYYSSIDGMLSPGVVRAYPASIEEIYSDGTINARISVWRGVETSVRVRLSGISPNNISGFVSVLGSRLSGQAQIFIQTSEQFDQEGILQGTVFYSTRNGYRDVAMDALDAQVAIPLNNQNIRIISQNNVREEPRCQQVFQRRAPCGSGGKLDGKKLAIDILGNILKR